jgi:Fic family protein
MKRTLQGRYVTVSTTGEVVRAFVPAPPPPRPGLDWTPELRRRFDDALLALGRLDAITALLPNARLLLGSFSRKEAVLSSRIEGTTSSFADLLLFEIEERPGVPVDDAREVSFCALALEHGLARLRDGFPMSLRLLREVHGVLMGDRGSQFTPGEFRRSQNWIGGTRPGNAVHVPPPPSDLAACLSELEIFLNEPANKVPPLVKAALAHVQFETIHPFLDGNGRVGRLLITLSLCADGLLTEPLLYPSLFFKRHRSTYYELLNEVRLSGDWEKWLDFFAEAIGTSATEAAIAARRLLDLDAADRERIHGLGRAAGSALAVHRAMTSHPIATSTFLVRATGLTAATVNRSLEHLGRLGVVAELTQRRRGRVFSYAHYLEILNDETEPLVGSA